MTRITTFFTAVIVAFALALPTMADAQASRRGGGGGSSSGGSGGGSASGGGSSGVAVPRSRAPQAAPPQVQPPAPAASRTSGSRPRPSSGTSGTRVAPTGGNRVDPGALRTRTVQATRGVAQPRSNVDPRPGESFNPWGRWYPWYSYGPSSYYGHVAYSPWLYGGTVWSWNRYGWHDPFLFDPFGYAGYGYGSYYWPSSGMGRVEREDDRVLTGSLRLRVKPDHARVYVDGALAGIASEFGGLTGHLDIPAGLHLIELRAEGYEPESVEVNVEPGRTRTERLTLDELPAGSPIN